MVLPWISERGFPGSRVDAKRAGMIATMANSGSGPSCTDHGTDPLRGKSNALTTLAAGSRLRPPDARLLPRARRPPLGGGNARPLRHAVSRGDASRRVLLRARPAPG